MSAKAKPKVVRERLEDNQVGHAKQTTGVKSVPRRRKPANKTKKKAKTANELMLEAWKYIWENRHRRLTKP